MLGCVREVGFPTQSNSGALLTLGYYPEPDYSENSPGYTNAGRYFSEGSLDVTHNGNTGYILVDECCNIMYYGQYELHGNRLHADGGR